MGDYFPRTVLRNRSNFVFIISQIDRCTECTTDVTRGYKRPFLHLIMISLPFSYGIYDAYNTAKKINVDGISLTACIISEDVSIGLPKTLEEIKAMQPFEFQIGYVRE